MVIRSKVVQPKVVHPNSAESNITALNALGLNVLVIDVAPPFPPDSGKRIRTWNLLRRLAVRHRITVLCYADPDDPGCAKLRELGIRVECVPPLAELHGARLYAALARNLFSSYPYAVAKHYSYEFERRLIRLLCEQTFDLVHCEVTQYASYLPAARGVPTLLATHNVESHIWFRRASHSRTLSARMYFNLQARRMQNFEQRIAREVDWCTTVTSLEADEVRSWGTRAVSIVDNGVDLDEFTPRPQDECENELVFVGSLDWYPNQDALRYFVRDIFPLIRHQHPGITLRVVGRRPPAALVRELTAIEGIEMLGEVDDVRPHVARSTAVVVPLRIGGGSRIKIVEAMAMRKAVVSTSVGAEGLLVRDGVHLALADSPEAFAQRTLDLLGNATERHRLATGGHDLAVARYSWDRSARALEEAWLGVAAVNVRRVVERATA